MPLGRLLHRLADNTCATSAASQYRRERFRKFTDLLESSPPPVKILDLGGTAEFWEAHRDMLKVQVHVTLLNQVFETRSPIDWITHIEGDGRWMTMFADKSFDLCFSNSVIEHVGTLYDQVRMAREIRRVAKGYFVQTPNKWFPIEPHFMVPLWQFLPTWFRARLLMRSNIGCVFQVQDYVLAKATIEEIRLLTAREMRWLFPDGEIFREKLGPLTKSVVAWRKSN